MFQKKRKKVRQNTSESAAIFRGPRTDSPEMTSEIIVAVWSHGAKTSKGAIKNLWVIINPDQETQPEPEPTSMEENHGTKTELTILTVEGTPCAEADMRRYKEGLQSGVQKTKLGWPLARMPPEMMNQTERNIVWNFMAWKDTAKPWMDLSYYWKQWTEEEAGLDPNWNPDFPFRLVKGMSEDGNDQSEPSISDDHEDQEDEEEEEDQTKKKRNHFRWKDHKGVKETRQKYRQKRNGLKKMGRTSKQALQMYYDLKDQKATEDEGVPTIVPRLPGHEWTIRPDATNEDSRTPARSSTSPP